MNEPPLHIAFVDESETRDNVYVFGAVIASPAQVITLTAQIERLLHSMQLDHGIPRRTELHAREIFGGDGAWAGVAPPKRLWLQQAVSRAIRDAGVTLCARGVDGPRLRARQARESYPVNFTVEQESFKHLLQRIDKHCSKGTLALVIADERSDRDEHRESLALHRIEGTPGEYWHTKFERIIDTVHFSPSTSSRMLQVADHYAFFYRRRYEFTREKDSRVESGVQSVMTILRECQSGDHGVWVP